MARKACRGGRGEGKWRGIIREQERSGQRVSEFCRRHKLAESTLYFWRRALDRGAGEGGQRLRPPARASFVPVRVTDEGAVGSAGRMEITLAGGVRVGVMPPVDGRALAEVLAVLAGIAHHGEGRGC